MVYLEGNEMRCADAQRFYCFLLRVSFGPAFAHQRNVPAFALSVVCAPLTRKHGTSEHHDLHELLPKRRGSGAQPLGRFLFEGGAGPSAFARRILEFILTFFPDVRSSHPSMLLYSLAMSERGNGTST